MTVGTGKFISKKVSAVRWQPVVDTSQTQSSVLAAGSWDDEANSLSVWGGAGPGGEASLMASTHLTGDVTGLEWLGPDTVSLSSSGGEVQVYRVGGLSGLQLVQEWPGLHRPGAGGATALTRHGDSLASGGQDGKLNVLVVTSRTPVKVYDKADSCSITALTFSKTSELVSSNMRGQIKTWDLRSNSQCPVSNSSQGGAVRCLAVHPTQSHVMMAGGEDGVLAVWDLRSPTQPATLLSADKAAISEVVFHPSQPDHVFTCSQGKTVTCHVSQLTLSSWQVVTSVTGTAPEYTGTPRSSHSPPCPPG